MRNTTGRDTSRALFMLVTGALMISFSGVWVKISHVSPTTSAFYRVFFGGLLLLPMVLIRKEVRRQSGRNLWLGLLCGFFFALDLYCFHSSVMIIGPGLGTILPNFQVFILTVFGIVFLKERIRPLALLSIPIAVAGLFMIIGVDGSTLSVAYKTGLLYGFAAAFCYSAFLLTLRKLQSDQMGVSTFYVLMMVSLATAIFLAPEVFREQGGFAIPDLQTFLALLALGLLSQAAGWIMIANSLPLIRTSLSGFILLLQPALSFVWDVLFFTRPTTTFNWLGVLVVLGAIYIGATAGKKNHGGEPLAADERQTRRTHPPNKA